MKKKTQTNTEFLENSKQADTAILENPEQAVAGNTSQTETEPAESTEQNKSTRYREFTGQLREKERLIRKCLADIRQSETGRFDIGRMLGEIRQKCLFMYEFDSFDEYTQARFGFKKAYACHLESAYHIRHALQDEWEKNKLAFDLPTSIDAAYKLKKAGDLTARIKLLKALKAAGQSVTAEAITAMLPKPAPPDTSKKRSVAEYRKLFTSVRGACNIPEDYGKDAPLLLDEVESVIDELNSLRDKLRGKIDAEFVEEQ